MSQPPGPYERSYSFTDFSTNNPNAQQPGQKIDQELNNVLTALNNTQDRLGELQADDGKLRETCLRMDTLGPAVAPFVSASAIDAINTAGGTQLTAVNTAGNTQVGLVNLAGVTVLADINAVINSSYAVSAIAASVSASNHAADALDSRQRADAFRAQAAEQAGLASASAAAASWNEHNSSLSAINALASKNAAQGFSGSCNTLKNSAQSAATLAEYWNGLAQAASASAEASATAARSVVENALTITLDGIQPYVDSALNSAYEASGYAAASAASAASADASAQSISSAGYITNVPWGDITGTLSDQTDLQSALDGKLSLAGGTMTGPIVFDGTSGQYISKGNFDTSRGGNYGISLVCSIGYEFNWQAGWLALKDQSNQFTPLNIDGRSGFRVTSDTDLTDNIRISPLSLDIYKDDVNVLELADWGLGITDETDGSRICEFTPFYAYVKKDGSGTTIDDIGITFPDATIQTTSASPVATVTIATGVNENYSPTTGNTVYVFDTSVSVIELPESPLLPIGTQMVFVNTDGSTLSFNPLCEGAGVVTSSGGKYTFETTGAVCAAIKLSLSPITWVITGELTA